MCFKFLTKFNSNFAVEKAACLFKKLNYKNDIKNSKKKIKKDSDAADSWGRKVAGRAKIWVLFEKRACNRLFAPF